MRTVKPSTLLNWARKHPSAAASLLRWFDITRKATWKSLTEIRSDFSQADMVRVESGKPVLVFNIAGNSFRLIAAVHFNTGRVFLLDFLSHAEYSKNVWKKRL
jgi:mRNA interferase HigB